MIQVNVTELRQHLPRYLKSVEEGETVQILSRGKPIANLDPIRDERKAARERLEAFRGTLVTGDVVAPLEPEAWGGDEDHL